MLDRAATRTLHSHFTNKRNYGFLLGTLCLPKPNRSFDLMRSARSCAGFPFRRLPKLARNWNAGPTW